MKINYVAYSKFCTKLLNREKGNVSILQKKYSIEVILVKLNI